LSPTDMQTLHDQTMPLRASWIDAMKERGLDGEPVLKGALKYLGLK
jgi:hypothetical protein